MMHGRRQIGNRGEREWWECVCMCVCVSAYMCGLNRVSHHLRSASPSYPLPLGSLGTWTGVRFTASWSGSEWMMGLHGQAECGVWCVAVWVLQCSSWYRHLHYLLVQGPFKPTVRVPMFRCICTFVHLLLLLL